MFKFTKQLNVGFAAIALAMGLMGLTSAPEVSLFLISISLWWGFTAYRFPFGNEE